MIYTNAEGAMKTSALAPASTSKIARASTLSSYPIITILIGLSHEFLQSMVERV